MKHDEQIQAEAPLPRSGTDRGKQIRHEAAKLFMQRGFAETSLQDVAAVVGITKAAIYYFYKSKDHIIEDILTGTLSELIQRSRTRVAAASGDREKLKAFFLAHAEYIGDNFIEFSATLLGFAGRSGDEKSHWISMRDEYESDLRKILTSGMQSGIFRRVDSAIASRAILTSLNGIARWWRPDGKYGSDHFGLAYLDLFQNGLMD